MSFPKYETYKDSGVEWLRELPEHWIPMRLKFNSYMKGRIGWQNLRSDEFIEEGPYLVTGMHFKNGEVDWDACYHISEERYQMAPEIILKPDDLLITKDGTIGKVAHIKILPGKASLNSHLLVLRPIGKFGYYPRFLYYVLDSYIFQSYAALTATGTTFSGISQESVSNFLMPSPSIKEQIKIARFLDYETARINVLIAEQERLIELLKEKRQAVISHAVTKGLDPTVSRKDSGVEWLGEVPSHWVVCQSKHLLDSVTSGSRGWSEYYSDDGYLFFRIANLTRDTIDPKLESKQFVNPPVGTEGERSRIAIDDILISITADLGSVCVANSAISGGYVSQHVALTRPCKKKIFSRWLAYFVLSTACKDQLLGAGYGGTKIQLSLEDIKSFFVSVPSYKEQIKIAIFLDFEVSKFESLINEAVLGITLLVERRSALISAAVTGKIDVRRWQAPANAPPSPTLEVAHG